MSKSHELSQFIWSIADLLRGPYRPPQYERVMLPLVVLRRFDCVLEPTKAKVLEKYKKYQGKLEGEALDTILNKESGQRFHNHSPLDFNKILGDSDNVHSHLAAYIQGFSENVRKIFERFEFSAEIERMREHNILFLVLSRFANIDMRNRTTGNLGDCTKCVRVACTKHALPCYNDILLKECEEPHVRPICPTRGKPRQNHPAATSESGP